ncbi:MAG: Asp-tRNA(Asn)/Glu-tRNA(Gln) amidotransferase subunit GatA [Gammaproteobacteria bacterium]|nr:Asp-tRNA(Asn)/Glu-tRNA(Gln) amidotransferase subunit GatA [Gammaproteobacteria bacterium]
MYKKTLAELSAGLKSGDFSSEELTRHCLERVGANADLNAFITVTAESAVESARAADRQLALGETGALVGIPIAHKDIFCTEGVLTSCGSRILSNFVSPYSATAIQQLADAGMVMIGKTNMDEFAMGSSNETSWYGNCLNPWDRSRVPGGSSGGSASAVAARLVPVATGTDTGGSIRQPAALTGITGIKPTYGRVSRYGMIAFASSLDQGGVLGQSAEDAALVLEAMAGFDPRDSTSVDEPVPEYHAALEADIAGLRIGVPPQFFDEGLEPAVGKTVLEALEVYRSLGAELVDIDLPNLGLSVPAYYVVAPAEASSNLSRYDGVRYGHRSELASDLYELYCKSRGEGFGAEVKRRIMTGTYALSAGYYDAYYLRAQKVRHLINDDFTRAFADVDVVMGPTAPTTAFGIGEKIDDPVTMYLTDIYTVAANLAGLPAMSLPCGFADGLPVGLQIIGRHFAESRLLTVAHRFQRETDWHRRIPEGF